VRLEEIVERGARAALLPDEPYAFGEAEAAELEALDAPRPIATRLVDGMDLFWYGTHVARAVARLGDEVARVRKKCFGSASYN
jgi:hypothetical protein